MAHPVVVVDVQERLFNAVDAERRDDMVTNVKILVSSARRLGVPVLVTEQYPKGLGRTLAVVTATETVVFQLLGSADSDAFRELSKLLR